MYRLEAIEYFKKNESKFENESYRKERGYDEGFEEGKKLDEFSGKKRPLEELYDVKDLVEYGDSFKKFKEIDMREVQRAQESELTSAILENIESVNDPLNTDHNIDMVLATEEMSKLVKTLEAQTEFFEQFIVKCLDEEGVMREDMTYKNTTAQEREMFKRLFLTNREGFMRMHEMMRDKELKLSQTDKGIPKLQGEKDSKAVSLLNDLNQVSKKILGEPDLDSFGTIEDIQKSVSQIQALLRQYEKEIMKETKNSFLVTSTAKTEKYQRLKGIYRDKNKLSKAMVRTKQSEINEPGARFTEVGEEEIEFIDLEEEDIYTNAPEKKVKSVSDGVEDLLIPSQENEEKMKVLNRERMEMQDKITQTEQSLKDEQIEMERKQKELEDANTEYSKQIEELQKKILEFNEDQDTLVAEIEEHMESNFDLNTKLKKLEEINQKSTEQIKELNQKLLDADNARKKLEVTSERNMIDNLEMKKKELTNSFEKQKLLFEKEIQSKENDIRALNKEIQKHNADISKLKNDLSMAQQEGKNAFALKAEMKEYQKQLEQMKNEKIQLLEQRAKSTVTSEDFKLRLSHVQERYEQKVKDITSFNENVKRENEMKLKSINTELAEMKSNLKAQETTEINLRKTLESERLKVSNLEQELKYNREKMVEVEKAVEGSSYKRENQKLTERIDKLNQEVINAQREVASVEGKYYNKLNEMKVEMKNKELSLSNAQEQLKEYQLRLKDYKTVESKNVELQNELNNLKEKLKNIDNQRDELQRMTAQVISLLNLFEELGLNTSSTDGAFNNLRILTQKLAQGERLTFRGKQDYVQRMTETELNQFQDRVNREFSGVFGPLFRRGMTAGNKIIDFISNNKKLFSILAGILGLGTTVTLGLGTAGGITGIVVGTIPEKTAAPSKDSKKTETPKPPSTITKPKK